MVIRDIFIVLQPVQTYFVPLSQQVPVSKAARFAGLGDAKKPGAADDDDQKKFDAPPPKTPDRRKRKWTKIIAFPAMILALFGLGSTMSNQSADNPLSPTTISQFLGTALQTGGVLLSVGLAFEMMTSAMAAKRRRRESEMYASGKIQQGLAAVGSTKTVSNETVSKIDTLRGLLSSGKGLTKTQEADLVESLEMFNDFHVYVDDGLYVKGTVPDAAVETIGKVVETFRKRDLREMAQVYAQLGLNHASAGVRALAKEFLEEHQPQLVSLDSVKVAEKDSQERKFQLAFVNALLERGQASTSEAMLYSASTAKALLELGKAVSDKDLERALTYVENGIAESELGDLALVYGRAAVTHPSETIKAHCSAVVEFRKALGTTTVSPLEQAADTEREALSLASEVATVIQQTIAGNREARKLFEKDFADYVELEPEKIIAQVRSQLLREDASFGRLSKLEQTQEVLGKLRRESDLGRYFDLVVPKQLISTILRSNRFQPHLTGDRELDALSTEETNLKRQLFQDTCGYVGFVIRHQAAEAEYQQNRNDITALETAMIALGEQKGRLALQGRNTEEVVSEIQAKSHELKLVEKRGVQLKEKVDKVHEYMLRANASLRNRTTDAQTIIASIQETRDRVKLTEASEEFLRLMELEALELSEKSKNLMEHIREREAITGVKADPDAFRTPEELEKIKVQREEKDYLAEMYAAEKAKLEELKEQEQGHTNERTQ